MVDQKTINTEIDWDTDDPIERAQLYRFEGQSDLAEEEYQGILEDDPSHVDAHFELTSLYFTLHNYDKADEIIRKGLELNPKSAKLHSALAVLKLNLGDQEQAKNALAKAEELDSQEYHVVFTKARFAFVDEDFQQARELFRSAADKAPLLKAPYSYLQLGLACLKQALKENNKDLLVEAENAFARAIEINPRWEGAYLFALEHFRAHPDPEIPLGIAEQGLAEFPDSKLISYLALRPLIVAGRLDDAEFVAQETMELCQKEPARLIEMARLIGEFDQFFEYVFEVLEFANEHNPDNLDIAKAMVEAYTAAEEPEKITHWQARVKQLSPID